MIELKIDTNLLRKNKIFLATPMYGGMCTGMYARSLADLTALCTHHGVGMQMYLLFNESLITRARNYSCDEFMRSDCSHMMFIDADIGFNAQDVLALLILQIQNQDYDIIGAPYPKKCISWEKIVTAVKGGFADNNPNDLAKYVGDYVFNPKGGTTSIPLASPAEVLEMGTGFMMIRKETMTRFRDAYTQYYYKPDHARTEHFDGSREILQYFQAEIDKLDTAPLYLDLINRIQHDDIIGDPLKIKLQIKKRIEEITEMENKKSKRYLSEDYWFSQKAIELGLKTWLCPWMKLSHMGSYVFEGSLADLAQIGAPATADPNQLNNKPRADGNVVIAVPEQPVLHEKPIVHANKTLAEQNNETQKKVAKQKKAARKR